MNHTFGTTILASPTLLKRYVKCIWHACPDSRIRQHSTYKLLADGAPGLIFHHDSGYSTIFERDGPKLPNSFIYGQATRPCYNLDKGNSTIWGIVFQPTALKALFGIDANVATNSIIDLSDMAGYNITEELLNAPNPESLRNSLTAFLLRMISKGRKEDTLVDRSIDSILQSAAAATTNVLYRNMAISKRQFQRRFKQHVGVCPETYIRIVRFQKSLHLLRNSSYSKLSDVAYGLGYSDQSHFIREFKFFSDYTPKDIVRLNPNFMATLAQNGGPGFATSRIVLC